MAVAMAAMTAAAMDGGGADDDGGSSDGGGQGGKQSKEHRSLSWEMRPADVLTQRVECGNIQARGATENRMVGAGSG